MTELKFNTSDIKHKISPLLYGVFFEDINYGADGGLYAELIANRSFSFFSKNDSDEPHKMRWETVNDAQLCINTENPLNDNLTHYATLKGGGGDGIKNTGFCGEGFAVKAGDVLNLTCYIKSARNTILTVKITDDSFFGDTQTQLKISGGGWKEYRTKLTALSSGDNMHFELLLENNSCIDIAWISLMPQNTFRGHKNGLRNDIAVMIEELSPKFVRFPGGYVVEGRSFDTMYNWKDTIHSLTERKINTNRWQMDEYQPSGQTADDYFQSYGIGFYEYFQFCEDIGAAPVPIINCGMTCQWHDEGILVPMEELKKRVRDVFDLIEFANGSKRTKWGARRAALGHPEPFNLEYIEIGNEQWGHEYIECYEYFENMISKEHPEIKLIFNAGYAPDSREFALAESWIRDNKTKAYSAYESFYKSPEWFLENINRYEGYDRTMPKVFIGEYAAHTAHDIYNRRSNFAAALSEAAFLTGIENNSDHVVMTCYAPLIARVNHQQRQPNLIWFDKTYAYGTPSYYVQKLFSNHLGDELLNSSCDDKDIKYSISVSGDRKHLIIKVVNLSDDTKHLSFDCEDYTRGEIFLLAGNAYDENSISDPVNIYPEFDIVGDFDGNYEIRGNSIAVFDLTNESAENVIQRYLERNK